MIDLNDYNIVCSKSIDKILSKYTNSKRFVVAGNCTYSFYKNNLEKLENVCAIGGGSVIDKAKIISKGPIKIAMPTTASGSTQTCHSVVWKENKKLSIQRYIPEKILVEKEFIRNIPERIVLETKIDMISHFFDTTYSFKSMLPKILENVYFKNTIYEEIVKWGIVAGDFIQKEKTSILHGLSYYLTSICSISHGSALSVFLPSFLKIENININNHFSNQEIVNFENFNKIDVNKKDFVDFSTSHYLEKLKKYNHCANMSKKDIKNYITKIIDDIA